MDKVLVEVICPATSKSYDFWIARQMTAGQAAARIAEDIMLHEMNDELFPDKDRIFLYFYENRALLNKEYTIEQSGVRSGCRLMVV